MSAAEREEDEENAQIYYKVPLRSIFSRIGSEEIQPFYYPLKPLSFETLMPTAQNTIETVNYKNLMDEMLKDFPFIDTLEKLLGVLEIYFSSVPAQTSRFVSDISLYDHSRVTAALAHSLYIDWENGLFNEKDIEEIKKWILKKREKQTKPLSNRYGDLSEFRILFLTSPLKVQHGVSKGAQFI